MKRDTVNAKVICPKLHESYRSTIQDDNTGYRKEMLYNFPVHSGPYPASILQLHAQSRSCTDPILCRSSQCHPFFSGTPGGINISESDLNIFKYSVLFTKNQEAKKAIRIATKFEPLFVSCKPESTALLRTNCTQELKSLCGELRKRQTPHTTGLVHVISRVSRLDLNLI